MSDDYLFDGRGPPDAEVAALERALRGYRFQRRSRWAGAAGLALAAAAVLAVGGAWWAGSREPGAWTAATASCDGCVWETGTLLDTQASASARLADRGLLEAAPGAVVRRLSGEGAHLALDRGSVDVAVVAPAGWLVIDVPGARVIDLGCAYRLSVDAAGNGQVRVTSGSVALQGKTRTEVLAGAAAATWPDGRTGLPVRLDAAPAFFAAVDAWDRRETSDTTALLDAARPQDAVTLWHLLDRQADPASRAQVIHRIEGLVAACAPPPPPAPSASCGADRAGLLAGEPESMGVLLASLIGLTW